MSRSTSRFAAWLPASAVGLALALGMTSCGDSNDDGDKGDANASQSQGDMTGTGSAVDRKAAAALMRRLRKQHNVLDGKGFCSNLTASGRREMVEATRSFQEFKARTCPQATVRMAAPFVKKAPHTPVRIKALKFNGDQATVTMNGGLAGIRSIATFRLTKDDGTWKLVDPVSGGKTRRLPKKYQ